MELKGRFKERQGTRRGKKQEGLTEGITPERTSTQFNTDLDRIPRRTARVFLTHAYERESSRGFTRAARFTLLDFSSTDSASAQGSGREREKS